MTWVGQKVKYDVLGRVESQSAPTEIDGVWNPTNTDQTRGWQMTSQKYDWKGRVTEEIGLDNVNRLYSYDGCGCAGGQVTKIEGELVDGKRRTQKAYADILGRTWKTETLDDNSNVYTSTVTKYNGRDQAVWVKQYTGAAPSDALTSDTCPAPTCQIATSTYDGHGRVKMSHAPQQDSGAVKTYGYNADDRPQSVTDARGASSTFTYNTRGLLQKIDYSLPGAASNFPTINPNSNLSSPLSEECTPEDPDFPNCSGGPTPTPTPNPQPYLSSVTFLYDALGNRTNMTDTETGATTYEYDSLSRMKAEHKQFRSNWSGVSNRTFDVLYTYNLVGQLKSVEDPFNQRIDYATDKGGKLKQITGTAFGTNGDTNQPITNYINDINYRAWGAVKQIDYGNGARMTQTFNNRLNLEEFKVEKPGDAVPHIKKNYQYYNDNRLKFSGDTGNNIGRVPGQFDRSYKYDFMGRLSEARTGVEARSEPLTDRNEVPYKQDYAYNVFGNVTTRNTFAWSQANNQTNSWTNGRESTWGYDADGRLKSTPETSYYYDAAGSMVMTTHSTSRRTIQHLDGEGKAARQDQYLRYNNQYNLLQSEYFIYSSVLGKLLTEVKSNGTKKRTFVYGMDGVVALQQYSGTTPEVRWEHTDPGNSTYLETTYSGGIYYDSQAELDPLGSNFGTSSPFTQQNAVQNALPGGWGYGSFGDPFGGYSCRIDGFERPCALAMYTVSIGVGYLNGVEVPSGIPGRWTDIDNPHRPPGLPRDIIWTGTISVFQPFGNFGGGYPFAGDSRGGQPPIPHPEREMWREKPKFDCESFLANFFGDAGSYFADGYGVDLTIGNDRVEHPGGHLYGSKTDKTIVPNVYVPAGGDLLVTEFSKDRNLNRGKFKRITQGN